MSDLSNQLCLEDVIITTRNDGKNCPRWKQIFTLYNLHNSRLSVFFEICVWMVDDPKKTEREGRWQEEKVWVGLVKGGRAKAELTQLNDR